MYRFKNDDILQAHQRAWSVNDLMLNLSCPDQGAGILSPSKAMTPSERFRYNELETQYLNLYAEAHALEEAYDRSDLWQS